MGRIGNSVVQLDEILQNNEREIYWLVFSMIDWGNKQQSDRFKIPSDGVPIGSGTLSGDLGGITPGQTKVMQI